MKNFEQTLAEFMDSLALDSEWETVWLYSMAHLELMIANQLLVDIYVHPQEEMADELKSVAEKHYENSALLSSLVPNELIDYEFEKKWELLRVPVETFFGAYICNEIGLHKYSSLLDIKNFCTQIYTLWVNQLNQAEMEYCLFKVKDNGIDYQPLINDKKFANTERDVQRAQDKKELILLLMSRLNKVIKEEALGLDKMFQFKMATFSEQIMEKNASASAWITALTNLERQANKYSGPDLSLSILSDQVDSMGSGLKNVSLYRLFEKFFTVKASQYFSQLISKLQQDLLSKEEVQLYFTVLYNTRVYKHFNSLMRECQDIQLSHKLMHILSIKSERLHLTKVKMLNHNRFDPQYFREISKLESRIFKRIENQVLDKMERVEAQPAINLQIVP